MYLSLKDSGGWLDTPENQLALGSWHTEKISLKNLEGQGCLFPLFKDVPLDNLKFYF